MTRRDEQNARFLVQGRDVQPVGAKLVSPWPRSFLGKPATQRTVVFGTSRASLQLPAGLVDEKPVRVTPGGHQRVLLAV